MTTSNLRNNNEQLHSKKPSSIKKYFGKAYVIQGIIVIYMMSSVLQKFASREQFLSPKFLGLYFLSISIIFIYAILWQIVLSQTELSVAYSHKSTTTVWTMLASAVFFDEQISSNMIIGAIFIIIGIYLVSTANLPSKKED